MKNEPTRYPFFSDGAKLTDYKMEAEGRFEIALSWMHDDIFNFIFPYAGLTLVSLKPGFE